MVFKRKDSFFLDLGSQDAKPAKVAVAKAEPAMDEAPKAAQQAPAKAKAAPQPAAAEASAAPASGAVLTTAEAIAAELRAAQEAKPAPSLSTFAPDALNPGNAMPMRRRRAGANLAGFKAMAKSMTGK